MVNQEYYKLGQKIRNFRIRSGKSQMELELEIGASAGSLSRIENGEVNPTKETLFNIAGAMKLESNEVIDLFGINISEFEDLRKNTYNQDLLSKELETIYQINNSFLGITDIQELCDTLVRKMVKHINVSYSTIWLWNSEFERLHLKAVNAPNRALQLGEELIGIKISSIYLNANDPNTLKNHILNSLLEDKENLTYDFYDFSRPLLSRVQAKIFGPIMNMKLAIHLPLIINGERLGAFGIIWNKKDISNEERKLITDFSHQVAMAIYNLKCFYDKFGRKFE